MIEYKGDAEETLKAWISGLLISDKERDQLWNIINDYARHVAHEYNLDVDD